MGARWCRGIAAERRCPGQEPLSVREAFAEEAPLLLPLPDHPYPLEERAAVKAGKTPYVRFDLNDYLSYSNRHADLLFELVSRRYEQKSTMITTNRCFADWGEVFPAAACVASLIDRLIHHAEIFAIDGESYCLKEANERAGQKMRQRRKEKS
jgi:hypothetical protein